MVGLETVQGWLRWLYSQVGRHANTRTSTRQSKAQVTTVSTVQEGWCRRVTQVTGLIVIYKGLQRQDKAEVIAQLGGCCTVQEGMGGMHFA